ncbi:ABC-2 transporter permease, partial [Bacillus cereus]|nr:ABC-2 transporter permease [Bacillus cereus]
MYNLFLKDLLLQTFMILFYIVIICLYQINLTNLLFTVIVICCMYMF